MLGSRLALTTRPWRPARRSRVQSWTRRAQAASGPQAQRQRVQREQRRRLLWRRGGASAPAAIDTSLATSSCTGSGTRSGGALQCGCDASPELSGGVTAAACPTWTFCSVPLQDRDVRFCLKFDWAASRQDRLCKASQWPSNVRKVGSTSHTRTAHTPENPISPHFWPHLRTVMYTYNTVVDAGTRNVATSKKIMYNSDCKTAGPYFIEAVCTHYR